MVESLASLCAIALVLSVVDGKPTTTSLDIARHFGRRHDNVMDAIRALIAQLPSDHLLNFQETVIQRANPSGGVPIDSPAYRITRDGFTLLAMGFTGKKALQFKLAYIDAFNKMEAQIVGLHNSAIAGAAPLPHCTPGGKSSIAISPAPLACQQLSDALVMGLNMAAHVQRTVARAMVDDVADWAQSRWVLSFIPSNGTTGPVPVMERLAPDAVVLSQKETTALMADAFTNAWRELDKSMRHKVQDIRRAA